MNRDQHADNNSLLEINLNLSDFIIVRYAVAVVSACIAETITYPFDLTKTRLQIQNEIASAKYGFQMENRGMLGTAMHIARNEGVHRLWSGLIAMWQRHALYAGCRIVIYERLRDLLTEHGIQKSLASAAFCGFTAGGIAQFIASPIDLVKVQMQTEGRRIMQGQPRRFTGTISVYKMLYQTNGIAGFWRGAIPNVQRAALVNVGNLAAYDYSKQTLKRKYDLTDSMLLHVCSAFFAGLLAATLSTPADVVKTRLMNQPIGKDGKGLLYKGVIDCIRQSVKNEGVSSFYKGFLPVWMRMAPWALINWVAFENIMLLIGGRTF